MSSPNVRARLGPVPVANTWHLLYRSRKRVALGGGLSAQIQVNYQQVD